MKYITTLSEISDTIKSIKELQKTDILLIFHKESETTVPLELLTIIAERNCKLEFHPISEIAGADIMLAFELGKIVGQNSGNVKNMSKNDIFLQLLATNTVKSTPKREKKKTEIIKEKEAVPENIENKETISKVENVKHKRGRKPKKSEPVTEEDLTEEKETDTQSAEISSDDVKFEEQYEKLFNLVSTLPKSDNFDPSQNIYGIITSIKYALEQNIPLEKAVKINCSSLIADDLFTAIKDKKKELTAIIKEMPDEK